MSFRHLYIERVSQMPLYENYIPVFKALADGTRLKIITILSGGEMCACKILEEFNITQPTLSYHMKILTESGLVGGVRNGAWMRYSLSKENIETFKTFITAITTPEA